MGGGGLAFSPSQSSCTFPFPFYLSAQYFRETRILHFPALSMFMSMRTADQVVRTDANLLERLSQAVRTDANLLFRTASERSGNGKPFGNGKPLVHVFA